jgi:sec-independent protein translocase protein TatC
MSMISGAARMLRRPKLSRSQRRARSVEDARMTLIEHLVELRTRLTRASLAVLLVTAVVGFGFYDQVLKVVVHPYCQVPQQYRFQDAAHPTECILYANGPTDQFTFRLKVAFFAGVLLSAPIWVYQLWAFIAPGLHRRERRYTYIFVAVSLCLFTIGGLLAYFLLAKTLTLLLSVGGSSVATILDVNKYVAFAVGMMLVFGVGFEFPLVLSLLNLAGVLPTARMRSWRRIVYFAMFVFAAVATPSTDPFTMTFLAIPLCILYELAIVFARLHDRRVRKRAGETDWAGLADDEQSPLDLTVEDVGFTPVAPAAPVPPTGRLDDDIT